MDEYGILGGYEDGLDEDDEKGSRAIPSRTTFGNEASFIKTFPCYGGNKRFLLGLVTVRNWSYRCELTLPQIELMQSDLPHTLYLNGKNRNDRTPNASQIDEATRLYEEAQRQKAERMKESDGQQSYTIEEIFNGVADED